MSTSPTLFFGQVSPEIAPRSLLQIEAAGKSGEEASVTERSRIWMISDIDGTNYNPATGAAPRFIRAFRRHTGAGAIICSSMGMRNIGPRPNGPRIRRASTAQ
ncbi:MAG: hypothetical protein M3463_11990, partial [Verrucomicrobiota bacterium]|nr:hypothetical protein [Verrucomicrobiota bacterium]